MAFNRRDFIGASLAAMSLASAPLAVARAADRKLKILFLGGTGFLGPHTVRYALERGHDVTLFNRGKTNTDLFPELETIIGNRDPQVDEGLSGLEGREWVAVIDNSALPFHSPSLPFHSPSLPFPSFPFPSLPFPFPSLPFPSLPFPSHPIPSLPFLT